MKKDKIYNCRLGNGYPIFVQVIGYIVLLLSIGGTFINPMALVIGLMVSGVVSFSSAGVLIDFERHRVRQYTSFFMIRSGKWRSLSDIPYVTVVFAEETSSIASQSNRTTEIKKVYFSVYLLNQTHRFKILAKHTTKKEEAVKFAEFLAEKLNIEFTVYNPVLSEQTRARRRR